MRRKNQRPKAQDVFNESSSPLWGQKTTFAEAFPEVESCLVEVHESGQDITEWNKERIEKNPGEYINCSNRICYNGGFNIGRKIAELVKKKDTFGEGLAVCQGQEASPQGRRVYRKCMNFFKYKITIKYKTMSSE